jgi:hypothetical protein
MAHFPIATWEKIRALYQRGKSAQQIAETMGQARWFVDRVIAFGARDAEGAAERYRRKI